MAFFDNFNNPLYAPIESGIGGLSNLFEGLTPFGTSIPSGILDQAQEEKLKKQALVSGLLGAGATYLATPKNLGAGSPLPYLGKAFLGGMGSSQDTINAAINNAYRQQLLAARDDKLYNVDGALVDKSGKVVYQGPGKQEKLPTSAEEFNLAKENPAYMQFLEKKWDSERKAKMADIQSEEAAYNIGRPQQSISVTTGGKTYYFPDQKSANAFRQKAGI